MGMYAVLELSRARAHFHGQSPLGYKLPGIPAHYSHAQYPLAPGLYDKLGHSLGAAGVHEAIFSLLMMQDDFLCASANINEIDPLGADFPIIRERIDNAGSNIMMSNSFGFGGTNATLVFRRWQDS